MFYCIDKGYNVIIPRVGRTIDSILKTTDFLRTQGYKVYLIDIDLDREKATQRAYYRYKETKRYIPLSYVFDVYSNEPTLSYYKIKQRYHDRFDGYAMLSTDVKKGNPPIVKDNEYISFIKTIYGGVII